MNEILYFSVFLFVLVSMAVCVLAVGAIVLTIFAVEDAIKNRQQQKAKKVVYHDGYYYCPECDADIAQVSFCNLDGSEVKEMYSYCWHCGQKIDWKEAKGEQE